jgi:iron complex outermembrane recepter protein
MLGTHESQRSRATMRTVATALVSWLLTLAGASASADAARRVQFNIAAQALSTALAQFSDQADLQFTAPGASLSDVKSTGVQGEYSTNDALGLLLKGTGFTYRFVDDGTVAITQVGSGQIASASMGQGGRVAQADTTSSTDASSATSQDTALEEVVVTAQKRVERLQDVPVPVSAVDTDALADNNQLLLRDYYTKIPGLYVTPGIQSNQTLSIRGITTGSGNPTIGVTVDDMPYGASTNLGGGRGVPDIDPGDLERVEVLRGPQGTLYGASSLGGLLKFVTRDPSTERVNARVQAGVNSVENGDEPGYNVRGSINVPLGDTWAMRASAFHRHDSGYVDNIQTGEEAVNSAEANGARLSMLWSPSERFSLKLNALHQQVEGDGAFSADPVLGDLKQNRLRNTGWYDRKARSYSATLRSTVGRGELTAISGYNVNSWSDSLDFSFGAPNVALLSGNEAEKFSQEVRFSMPIGEKFEWLLGAFYTDEDSNLLDTRWSVDPATGALLTRNSYADILTTFEEYAAFADLTYRVTERFDVQVGGRQSEIDQTFRQVNINALGVTSLLPLNGPAQTAASAFTYLVTPRFKLSPNLMLYARLASGYRAGGTNIVSSPEVPPEYDPDKTRNYEIGLKGNFLDNALSVDASLYYIDWEDIQLTLVSAGGFTHTTNGSRAKSQGVEFAVEARPLRGLDIAAWIVWNEAELTKALPVPNPLSAFGLVGDRLPNSSRYSGNVSLEQQFPLLSDWNAFVGGAVSYVGDRIGPFRPTVAPLRETLPDYTQVDLRAGVRNDSWTANLFVTNVGDKRGRLSGGRGANPNFAYQYVQPRTVGVSFTKNL